MYGAPPGVRDGRRERSRDVEIPDSPNPDLDGTRSDGELHRSQMGETTCGFYGWSRRSGTLAGRTRVVGPTLRSDAYLKHPPLRTNACKSVHLGEWQIVIVCVICAHRRALRVHVDHKTQLNCVGFPAILVSRDSVVMGVGRIRRVARRSLPSRHMPLRLLQP